MRFYPFCENTVLKSGTRTLWGPQIHALTRFACHLGVRWGWGGAGWIVEKSFGGEPFRGDFAYEAKYARPVVICDRRASGRVPAILSGRTLPLVVKNNRNESTIIGGLYPRRESNSQSPDPWSGALSIGPRGHCILCDRDKPNYIWWASYEWRLQNLNPRPITSLIIESLHPHLKRALRYFFKQRKLLKSLPLINRNIFENSSPATASARAAQLTLSRPRMSTPSNKWRGQENP